MNKLENFTPRPATAYLLLILAAAAWGASTVVGRGVHLEIPPVGLSFWRTFVGLVFLLPLALPEVLRKRTLIVQHLPFLFFLGAIQLGAQAIMMISLNFTTAINASILNASQPAITAIIAWVLIHERLSPLQGIGIAGALAGVVMMAIRADLDVLLQLKLNIGDVLVVVAVVGWSLYSVKLPKVPKELGLTTLLFMVLLTGELFLAPFYAYESLMIRTVPFTMQTVVVVIGLGIFVAALAIFVWNAGIRVVGPNKASVFINFIPVFGTLFAIIFLDEQLFAYHGVGAALVVAGVWLVIRHKNTR